MKSCDATNPSGDWRAAGLRYHRLDWFFRRQFGGRVRKISIDAGFTCPNRDGTIGTGGCIYCSIPSFSPSRRLAGLSITAQIDQAIGQFSSHRGLVGFLAYFQPATNTYAPVERLREVFWEAADHPRIVGLAIGTRPDCVPEEVLDLLAELAERTWVLVEYGLQSAQNRSLAWLRRGHTIEAFADAVARTRPRAIPFGVHLILGIPGETREDLLTTAHYIGESGALTVKLHNLHAVRDTTLAEWVSSGQVRLLDQDEYVQCVVDFLEILPARCVVDRLCATAPRPYLLAPDWCLNPAAVREAVEAELVRRDSWQGKRSTLV